MDSSPANKCLVSEPIQLKIMRNVLNRMSRSKDILLCEPLVKALTTKFGQVLL